MDTSGAKEISVPLDAKGLKFAVVVSRFNALVTKELLEGAIETIVRHGGKAADQTVIWVPGGFEIPFAVKQALKKGGFDAVIALGCVMKGATSHNDHIAAAVTSGIASLSLEFDVPVTFGVLTPDTTEQALERAGLKMGNKGSEAAAAAIEMALVKRALK